MPNSDVRDHNHHLGLVAISIGSIGHLLRLTEIDKDCRVSARIFPSGLEKFLVNEFLIGNGNP